MPPIVLTDFHGIIRPQGAAYDLGAFEIPAVSRPSWVTALALNQMYRIPGTSFWSAAVQAQYTPGLKHPDISISNGGGYDPSGATGDIHLHGFSTPKLSHRVGFSGCGWDPGKDEIYLYGGGHAGSLSNEVLRFRANRETPDWTVIGQPSDASMYSVCQNGSHVPPLTYDSATFAPLQVTLDGKPQQGHQSSRNQFLPSVGAQGSLFTFFGGVGFWGSGGPSRMYRFDVATQQWIGGPGVYPTSFSQLVPNPGFPGDYRHCAVVDERTDTVYFLRHSTGHVWQWGGPLDPFTVTARGSFGSIYAFEGHGYFQWPVLIDESRNRMVVATGGGASNRGPLRFMTMDLASFAKQLHTPTWNVTELTFPNSNAMIHDTDADRYILWRCIKAGGGEPYNLFYTVDPATWVVDALTLNAASDALPPQLFLPLNRMRYSRNLKGALIVSSGSVLDSSESSTHFLRLH